MTGTRNMKKQKYLGNKILRRSDLMVGASLILATYSCTSNSIESSSQTIFKRTDEDVKTVMEEESEKKVDIRIIEKEVIDAQEIVLNIAKYRAIREIKEFHFGDDEGEIYVIPYARIDG